MKPFFKPEDFDEIMYDLHNKRIGHYQLAEYVNTLVQELVDASPVVYYKNIEILKDNYCWIENNIHFATKKARLMFIEEIPEKECEHKRIDSIRFTDVGRCFDCGKEMIKDWRVK